MGDNDANSKDKNEKDVVNAASKSAKKTEDADEITDRSATNSEYILCK